VAQTAPARRTPALVSVVVPLRNAERWINEQLEALAAHDPHDLAAIAAAVRYILEHSLEAEEMGTRGIETVASRYNWEAEAGKLLALYEGLQATSARAYSFRRTNRRPTAHPESIRRSP
jgi:glycosyltransferase involved in cell wall biosynthesis